MDRSIADEWGKRLGLSCYTRRAVRGSIIAVTPQKPKRQIEAERIADLFRANLRKPLVIEFAGTPKSGKSTTIDQVRAFLKRCGFRVDVVVERASVCPIRDKRHASFNMWTAATSIAQLLEKTQDPPRPDDPDILILDRGIFDSVVWLRLLEKLKRLTKEDREKIEGFVLMERLRSRVSAVVAMSVDSKTALERERGLLEVVDGAGRSIMTEKVLDRMREQTLQCIEELKGSFKIKHVDTSGSSTAKQTAETVADFVLELARKLVDEDVLHISASDISHYFSGKQFITDTEAENLVDSIRASAKYDSRSIVEDNSEFVQPIPVAVIRNQKGELLLLKRRESTKENHLHDKFVVWAGGHVREEDASNGDPILHCLCRELDEELRLSIDRKELKFIGAVYDPVSEKSKKHLALLHEWQAPTDDDSVTLTAAEFRERRGNSVSGTFQAISGIRGVLGPKSSLEPWSKIILREVYKASLNGEDTNLFSEPQ